MPSTCTASNRAVLQRAASAAANASLCSRRAMSGARVVSSWRRRWPVVRGGTGTGGNTRASSLSRATSTGRSPSAKLSSVTSWRWAKARSRCKLRRLVPCCGG
ncbi:MAG: hypothetical protein IPH95_04120 [Candidatus Promineofilum sp.]|nr:hypothetical protein [Promineifilum sp.]